MPATSSDGLDQSKTEMLPTLPLAPGAFVTYYVTNPASIPGVVAIPRSPGSTE